MWECLIVDVDWEVWTSLLESIAFVPDVSLFKISKVGFVTYLLHIKFPPFQQTTSYKIQSPHVSELPLLLLHLGKKCPGSV